MGTSCAKCSPEQCCESGTATSPQSAASKPTPGRTDGAIAGELASLKDQRAGVSGLTHRDGAGCSRSTCAACA